MVPGNVREWEKVAVKFSRARAQGRFLLGLQAEKCGRAVCRVGEQAINIGSDYSAGEVAPVSSGETGFGLQLIIGRPGRPEKDDLIARRDDSQ
jgi:hypothetical protein